MNQHDTDFLVQKIRTQYTEKEHTQLDALRDLDKKVKRPANVFAYTFGSIGAIIMGSGMSLVMTDMGSTLGVESLVPGIIIGIIGMVIASSNMKKIIVNTEIWILLVRRLIIIPAITIIDNLKSNPLLVYICFSTTVEVEYASKKIIVFHEQVTSYCSRICIIILPSKERFPVFRHR